MTGTTTAAAAAAGLDTIYQCPDCEELSTGRRCPDCNLFTRRLGPGGPCPHCDEIVLLDDLTNQPATSTTGTYTENLTSSAGPMLGYVLSRSTGLPSYTGDERNWFGDAGAPFTQFVDTTAFAVEIVLLLLAAAMLLRRRLHR